MKMQWEYYSFNVAPGESWYDVLRKLGSEGWEAWHIERGGDGPASYGWRTLYFKRPKEQP